MKFNNLCDRFIEENMNRRVIPNIINSIYNKPIASFILNDEKLRIFPLKSGMKQG
jgi:hypothetical protein